MCNSIIFQINTYFLIYKFFISSSQLSMPKSPKRSSKSSRFRYFSYIRSHKEVEEITCGVLSVATVNTAVVPPPPSNIMSLEKEIYNLKEQLIIKEEEINSLEARIDQKSGLASRYLQEKNEQTRELWDVKSR